ncbi:hypothetical protein DBR32_02370 [Taibaiella sp. KBW10]|uniref:hypothetical protein n=1 Tax=Taibaiella sp. KBW10 TaxID=2153357 RepID=UPI000F595064|nr:hypothetical protein [Taibaiella sp. KBW10]RQO32469.1 hypothetical protein DBR32_02370 [Taibaiella sp. KBW10]
MKKVLLAAFALIATYGIADANVMTVQNLTACTYTLSTSTGQILTAPPGLSTFTSTGSLHFVATKVVYNFGVFPETTLGVGLGSPYANTMGQTTPPCLVGTTYYTGSWSQASPTANATLVIF